MIYKSLVAQLQRICLPTKEMQVRSLIREDALEKEMATRFTACSWEISGTEEPGGLKSMGCKRAGHDLVAKQQ